MEDSGSAEINPENPLVRETSKRLLTETASIHPKWPEQFKEQHSFSVRGDGSSLFCTRGTYRPDGSLLIMEFDIKPPQPLNKPFKAENFAQIGTDDLISVSIQTLTPKRLPQSSGVVFSQPNFSKYEFRSLTTDGNMTFGVNNDLAKNGFEGLISEARQAFSPPPEEN